MFVCKDLSKVDLGSVRLVSKAFDQAASPFKFRSVWISIESGTWYDVNKISQHPVLRNYVREICYDNTRYEKELCSRKVQMEALTSAYYQSSAAVRRGLESYRRFYDEQMNHDLLHENKILDQPSSSLESALTKARETRNTSQLKQYLSKDLVSVIQAFMSMPNVDTFSLSNSRWYDLDHDWATVKLSRSTTAQRSYWIYSGRKLGRDQISFDPVPPQATVNGLSGAQRGFQLFLQAASIGQPNKLRHFNLGPVVPNNYSGQFTFLDFSMIPTQLQMAGRAFSGLTTLDLRFVGCGPGNPRPQSNEEQAILHSGKVGELLHHATGLTSLAIGFGKLSRIDDLSWMLGQDAWHSLHRVTLRSMDVYVSQLVNFLLLHSSSLQYLCLEDLVFREEDTTNVVTTSFSNGPGSWSEIFQAIAALELSELSVARLGKNVAKLECPVWHSKVRADIQSFLLSGGSVLFVLASLDVDEEEDEEEARGAAALEDYFIENGYGEGGGDPRCWPRSSVRILPVWQCSTIEGMTRECTGLHRR